MKRVMMLAALLVASVSCVSGGGDSAVRLLHARVLKSEGTGCSIGEFVINGGELDISGGRSYVLGLNIESNTVDPSLVVGGEDFGSSGLNDVILKEIVLSYEAQPALSLSSEETIPIYHLLRAGTSDESSLLINAIGPLALQQINDSMCEAQSVTLSVTIKVRGEMGNKAAVESNELTFPIVLVKSAYSAKFKQCKSGTLTDVVHPCGYLGQDQGLICYPPPEDPPPPCPGS